MKRLLTAVLGCCWFAGCGQDGVSIDHDDVVRVGPSPSPITIDSFETVWRDDGLGRPTLLVHHDGTLVVGDQDRIHFLSSSGEFLGSAGRAGEGPGEFGLLGALHAGSDGVVAVDTRNRRLTLLSWNREFDRDERARWPEPYVSARGDQLGRAKKGLISFARAFPSIERPTRAAVVWQSLERDSVRIVGDWADREVAMFGQVMGEMRPLGPRAIVGIAPDGSYVFGDGSSYCYTLVSPFGARERRFCRERAAVPVGPGARGGSVQQIPTVDELPVDLREGIAKAVRDQVLGSHYPLYDALRLSEGRVVWVRLAGVDQPDVHPTLALRIPEAQPSHRTWESIDEHGIAGPTLRFERAFDPRVFLGNQAYGFAELPTGELVVARATW